MTTRIVIAVATLLASSAALGRAQPTQCSAVPTQVRDLCGVSVDLYAYVMPQLAVAVAAGNTMLAEGGTVGSLPSFSIGVRTNVVYGNLPILQTPSTTGPSGRTVANPYPTVNQLLVLPMVDATVGVFRGFRIGPTRMGGLDVLLSGTFVPTISTSSSGPVSIRPDSPLGGGFGARVGLIEERLLIPGVGVSVMSRRIPATATLTSTGADTIRLTDVSMTATSWRLAVSKSLVGFTFAAGAGQDIHDSSAGLEAIVNAPPSGRFTTGLLAADQRLTRSSIFFDGALNLSRAKLVVEGGIVTGGSVPTFNVFDVKADVSRVYGSAGLRIAF